MAVATNVRLHETSSWHLDFSDRRSSHKRETPRDKLVASRFQRPAGVAASVRLHETSSWRREFSDRQSSRKGETPGDKLVASRFQRPAGVAASVRLHETSSWRLEADINSICVADKANSSPHDQCAQGRLSSRMRLGNIDLH